MAVQEMLAYDVLLVVCTSTLIAFFVVLVATRSLRGALLSVLTIGCVVIPATETVVPALAIGVGLTALIYAGGHIYLTTVQGESTVFQPGKTYKEVATNELDTGCMASPAATDNALYLRTKTHLYRIEK